MLPKTVPIELYFQLADQVTQALQAIAALALTDEEVAACRAAHGGDPYQPGWVDEMKNDLLAPGPYGRDMLLDMLKRHEFLINSHAGFVFGPFEGPAITLACVHASHYFIEFCDEYGKTKGPYEDIDAVKEKARQYLLSRDVDDKHIEFILERMSLRICDASRHRMYLTNGWDDVGE